MKKKILFPLFFALILVYNDAYSQYIFGLMERKDLTIREIETTSKRYFDSVGTGKGTGYKQFQRWLYELQFHTDKNGYILSDDHDRNAYHERTLAVTPVQWKELGPSSWNRTNGWNPGVGRITGISVHPLDTSIIYVTSPGGGLWKSTTGGNNWIPLTDKNDWGMNLFSVSVDPANLQVVYAGNSGGQILKSTDGGATFTTIFISGMSGNVKKILISPTNSNIIFACSSGGIHRSTNGGTSWTRVHAYQTEDIEFKPNDENIMYATGNGNATGPVSSVFRSTDNGVNWTAVTNGISTYGRTLVSVSASNPNRVFVVQASGALFGYFYRSDDAGLTFTIRVVGDPATNTNFFGYEPNGSGLTGQAGYDMAMCANPNNADEVHIGGIICWKSTNGGDNWVSETVWSLPNTVGYNHADVHDLSWVKKTIYSGTDGGIYKSTDYGDNWTELSNGLGIRQFYRMSNSSTSTTRITGGAQDNGSSVKRITGWVDWLGADGMDCLFSPLDSNILWGTIQNGGLNRSLDSGKNWINCTKPSAGNWITPLAIESNSNTIYGGWTGVYKSTDLGVSWTKISGSVIGTTVTCLAVAPSNPLYIYATVGSTIYFTNNGGTNWATYVAPATIAAITVSPSNPEKIWIAGSASSLPRAAVSVNSGFSFTDISAGLPEMAARTIAVDNSTDEGIYLGMNVGVYFKDNNSPWQEITSNIPLVAVNEVDLQHRGRVARICTYGRGVWERSMAGGFCTGSTIALPATITGSTYQWELNTGSGFTNISNGSTYSGALTANLSINGTSSMYGYFYRCAVTTSGVTTYSPVYKLKFTSIWLGLSDTDWNNPANWSCNSIPDANTDVFVDAEKARYPVINQNVTVRSLTLAKGVSLNVQTGAAVIITGQ